MVAECLEKVKGDLIPSKVMTPFLGVEIPVSGSLVYCATMQMCWDLFRKQMLQERVGELEWVWNNCKIVFFPEGGAYPIEHNPNADKDSRILIETEMNQLLSRKDSDG